MGIDKQGKNSVNTPTNRGNENKPSPVTTQTNKTRDAVDKTLKPKR